MTIFAAHNTTNYHMFVGSIRRLTHPAWPQQVAAMKPADMRRSARESCCRFMNSACRATFRSSMVAIPKTVFFGGPCHKANNFQAYSLGNLPTIHMVWNSQDWRGFHSMGVSQVCSHKLSHKLTSYDLYLLKLRGNKSHLRKLRSSC